MWVQFEVIGVRRGGWSGRDRKRWPECHSHASAWNWGLDSCGGFWGAHIGVSNDQISWGESPALGDAFEVGSKTKERHTPTLREREIL